MNERPCGARLRLFPEHLHKHDVATPSHVLLFPSHFLHKVGLLPFDSITDFIMIMILAT